MTHLTLTGVEAGRTLCGAPKTGDSQYMHAMYAPIGKLAANEIPGYAPLCGECLRIWSEDDSDD